MRTTLLLCDAAQEVGGKLYVLGGGWSVQQRPGPTTMALAIKIAVPWADANQPLHIVIRLVTEDGAAVLGDDRPVELDGHLTVGRPAGVHPGSDLDAVLTFTTTVPLDPGGYRWELDINDVREAHEPFRVLQGPAG